MNSATNKIGVFGTRGFIGSNLSIALSKSKNISLINISDSKITHDDIYKSPKKLKYFFNEEGIDTIINCSSSLNNLVNNSNEKIIEKEVTIAKNIMEASISSGVCKNFITLNSVLMNDSNNSNNAYKIACYKKHLFFISNKDRINCHELVLGNIYGNGDPKLQLIPSAISAILNNERLEIKNPSSIKNFLYISDLINLFLKIVNGGLMPGSYRVKGGESLSVECVLKEIFQSVNKSKKLEFEDIFIIDQSLKSNNKNNIENLPLSIQTLPSSFWKPSFSFKKGLIEMISEVL